MKIGLWNIDHPELTNRSPRRQQRYLDILTFLTQQSCDLFVLTEANAALQLDGFDARFSQESPFKRKGREETPPNRYHQIAIHSRFPLARLPVAEPINGLLCSIEWHNEPLMVYGNVVTIKDQWHPTSGKRYRDRLAEQLQAIAQLAGQRFIALGDSNLKVGWPQKKGAYRQLQEMVEAHSWCWPTQLRTDTVQHVIHTPDLFCTVTVDPSVKENGLSDHPFMLVDLAAKG